MLLYPSENALGDGCDPRKALPRPCLSQRKDRLLGVVEYHVGVVLFGQCLARDRVARPDQIANDRFVADDLDILFDIRKMRQAECEIRDRRDAADRFKRAFFFQLFADQDRIDLLLLFKKRDHRRKNTAIKRRIKILRLKMLDRLSNHRIIKQYRTQNNALALFA